MSELSPEDRLKQERYRDARTSGAYDEIWQSVGKCVFCDLKDKYIIFEENGIVLTISLFAYIDGHCMIIPRRHVTTSKELTQLEWDTVRKFAYIAKKLIKKVHGIKGFQMVQKDGNDAQSTVGHLHFHCIPFDAPDLAQWNVRKLTATPLENAALYRQAGTKIADLSVRFQRKYRQSYGMSVVCDAVIINSSGELLLQVRRPDQRFMPDYLSLPGGIADDYTRPFEAELCRELQEEISYNAEPADLKLLASRPGAVTKLRHEKHADVTYPAERRFTWNTYLLNNFDETQQLVAGDDCQELVWLPLTELSTHPQVSPEIAALITELIPGIPSGSSSEIPSHHDPAV